MKDKLDNGQNKDSGRSTIAESISAAQFEIVERAAAAHGVTLETEPAGGPPLNIWQKDHILVGADVDLDANEDLRRLGAEPAPIQEGLRPVARDDLVRLLRLAKREGVLSTRQVVAQLAATNDLAGRVFVNNLMYVAHSDGANICPAAEPVSLRPYPHTIPYPPPSRGSAGEGVRIAVIDTGLSPGLDLNHPWLGSGANPGEVDGSSEIHTYEANGDIAPYAEHGTFVAGLIRCVAPRAKITVWNTLRWAGSMSEVGVAQKIMEVLDDERPDIICLPAGCLSHAGPGAGPQAMVDVLRRLAGDDRGPVLVAAAGNDGRGPADEEQFYPAAFAANGNGGSGDGAALVAVGALRQDRLGRACFSNYADWVTVYEEGENLINAFPVGRYTYREPLSGGLPPRCGYYPDRRHPGLLQEGCTCVSVPARGSVALFHGMAMWSGTSFATSIAAARIVRHMTENPEFAGKPRNAVRDLLTRLVTITDAGDGRQLPVFPEPAVR